MVETHSELGSKFRKYIFRKKKSLHLIIDLIIWLVYLQENTFGLNLTFPFEEFGKRGRHETFWDNIRGNTLENDFMVQPHAHRGERLDTAVLFSTRSILHPLKLPPEVLGFSKSVQSQCAKKLRRVWVMKPCAQTWLCNFSRPLVGMAKHP